MLPTEDLEKDHGQIKVMLCILEKMSEIINAGDDIETKDLDAAVEFLKMFADRCHHSKEEEWLFPALEQAGIPKEGGPIGQLLLEHQMAREFVKKMADIKKFSENALGYVHLLDQHIEKENVILFPMADQKLSTKQQKKVSTGFLEIEEKRLGKGTHIKLHKMLEKLEKIYLK